MSSCQQLLAGISAGTYQAWVPNEKLEHFKSGMEALLGSGTCHVLHIRPQGGCVVAE